jgi:gluconokinase
MPPALLHSQFEALEEPGANEHPVVISIEPRPREIVEQIVTALKLKPGSKPARAGT